MKTEVETPKALEAERAVIGAALLEPDEVVPLLKEALTVNDFYERRHQRFFEAMLALHEQGAPVTEREVIELQKTTAPKRPPIGSPVSLRNWGW